MMSLLFLKLCQKKRKLVVGVKRWLALICCASYNPITNMHLRMFEVAKNYFETSGNYEVLVGIASPVSDGYKKKDLIDGKHRGEMVRLAVGDSDWLQFTSYESDSPVFQPTYEVMQHFKDQLTRQYGRDVRLMLLCGADLVDTFNIENLWRQDHIRGIVSEGYGLVVIKRDGSDPERSIYQNDILYKHRHNIHVLSDWVNNDTSSTKIRRALRRNESVKYLIPDSVLAYIKQQGLYSLMMTEQANFY